MSTALSLHDDHPVTPKQGAKLIGGQPDDPRHVGLTVRRRIGREALQVLPLDHIQEPIDRLESVGIGGFNRRASQELVHRPTQRAKIRRAFPRPFSMRSIHHPAAISSLCLDVRSGCVVSTMITTPTE
jgi:hypothetical protein